MERILKIVNKRNKERKLLTKDDVRKIYSILIEKKNCQSIDRVEFPDMDEESPETAGVYYWDTEAKKGTINIYNIPLKMSLDHFYEETCNELNYSFDGAKIDTMNWHYLSIIFHEFSHAMDRDAINKKRKDYGTKLAQISKRLMDITDFYEFYHENYEDMPTEVKARNIGNLDTYNIYSQLPEEFLSDSDKNMYGLLTILDMQSNYMFDPEQDKISSAIERIYEVADNFNLAKYNIDAEKFKHLVYDTKNLTLYDKLIWGLPISHKEYGEFTIIQAILGGGQNIDFVKRLQRKIKKEG